MHLWVDDSKTVMVLATERFDSCTSLQTCSITSVHLPMSGIVTGCRLWLKVRLMLHGKLLLTRTPQHLWGICNLLWQQSSRAPSASSVALISPMALGSSMRASLPCAADAHASAPIHRGTFLRPLSALGPCAVLASSTMLFLPPGPFKRPFRICVSAMPSERSPDSLKKLAVRIEPGIFRPWLMRFSPTPLGLSRPSTGCWA